MVVHGTRSEMHIHVHSQDLKQSYLTDLSCCSNCNKYFFASYIICSGTHDRTKSLMDYKKHLDS